MLQTPYTISDLIKYIDNEEFKKLLTPKQIEIIKEALEARWTFKKEAA